MQRFLKEARLLGLYKKIFFVSFVIVAVGLVILNTDALSLLGKPINLGLKPEEAVIRKASIDKTNNKLLLDVQSTYSKTIIFNAAVIKDSQHNTVATIVSFQNELPAQTSTIITVDLSTTNLSSGNYTIDLWTTNSHFFSSPSFTVR
jgi:hypothetical protein